MALSLSNLTFIDNKNSILNLNLPFLCLTFQLIQCLDEEKGCYLLEMLKPVSGILDIGELGQKASVTQSAWQHFSVAEASHFICTV